MIDKLTKFPVVPVFYHADLDYTLKVVQASYDGGLRFFEFTNRGEAAERVFAGLRAYVDRHCPELSLGVGTVYTENQAGIFISAGADFIVQPVTTPEVGAICQHYQKPWIPGAMTLNEIWNAWQLGANAVKVFPGNLVGPEYIRALRGPMPDVPLMVTGGVEPTTESIKSWLNAGAQAVGIGSQWFKGMQLSDLPAFSKTIENLVHSLEHPSSSV